MKKECEKLIRELKKIFPDADNYSAEANIATYVDNGKRVRYTAHASPIFCACCEGSVEVIIEMALKEAAEVEALREKMSDPVEGGVDGE
jgi:hypothetical protein